MIELQFLPTRQISSEFFIFQQDSVPAHRALLEAIDFSPISSPNIERFLKLSKQTQ